MLGCPQRDTIESLLRRAKGDGNLVPCIPVKPTVTLSDGRTLHLLGVSQGTNGRPFQWQDAHVAVFGTQPQSVAPQLPKGMSADGSYLVHAAVLLDRPDQPSTDNEFRVTLVARAGTEH